MDQQQSALQQVMAQMQSGQYTPPQNGQQLQAPSASLPPDQAGGAPMPQDASQSAMPFESPEAKMIVGALSNRLKGITEMEKGTIGIHPTQNPEPQGGMPQ